MCHPHNPENVVGLDGCGDEGWFEYFISAIEIIF